jgi:hypothetical protein
LLASFQNHLSDEVDRARRLKWGGGKEFVELDAVETEERYWRDILQYFDVTGLRASIISYRRKFAVRDSNCLSQCISDCIASCAVDGTLAPGSTKLVINAKRRRPGTPGILFRNAN